MKHGAGWTWEVSEGASTPSCLTPKENQAKTKVRGIMIPQGKIKWQGENNLICN